MKIAFISRSTLFTVPGGDTRQVDMTAKYLRKLGVEVDIHLSNEGLDYGQYDLLHFFNITRPADIMKHIRLSQKPFVVSTIFVEHNRVNEESKGPLFRFISSMFSPDGLSYLKIVARSIINNEKIISKRYLYLGHKRSIKWIVKKSSCLLPNSESEMQRFKARYRVDAKHIIVPNGIDTTRVLNDYEKDPAYENAVICMARFEPLKNQLALITCMNDTCYQVYLHGKPSPNNHAYYEQCKSLASGNVHIRDWAKDDELYRIYASAKVHVLPSYFETTGLSSLEAAAMGCNIVVTDKGDTRDYFADDAWYCNPDDPASIKLAIEQAFNAPYNVAFRDRILRDFTWQRTAEVTYKAYQQVLENK